MNPIIGVSANFFHPDPDRRLYKGKRLLYWEQELLDAVARNGGLPFPVPFTESPGEITSYVEKMHGLVLSGGEDVAPESYREVSHEGKWLGDRYRDQYELELIDACMKKKLPILGTCRGIQILNVYFGGTIHRDIQTFGVSDRIHRSQEQYDQLVHQVKIQAGSRLSKIYPEAEGTINSVHHQSISKLGTDLAVSAVSDDGVIEGVELNSKEHFVVGVQWHPEWTGEVGSKILNPDNLIKAFLKAVSGP